MPDTNSNILLMRDYTPRHPLHLARDDAEPCPLYLFPYDHVIRYKNGVSALYVIGWRAKRATTPPVAVTK